MTMFRKQKEEIVNELANSLSRCTIVIATDYRGLPAKEMVQMRRRLSEQGIEYRVAKNTLTRFAAKKAGKKQLEELLVGPLAMVFGYDDVIIPAKTISEYIRSSGSNLKIKGGMMGNTLLNPREISTLASIPPRDILVSQLIGQLWAPMQTLHNVLSTPLQKFIYVIQARIQQIEGG